MHFELHLIGLTKCIKLYFFPENLKKILASQVNLGVGWVTINTGIFFYLA